MTDDLIKLKFAAIAKSGAYVYCYLRETASATAKAGTPYYIGIASSGDRPFHKNHNAPVPRDRQRVRILRQGLTPDEARRWECFYIARFGRKDIGTGILCNLTNGGEGAYGAVRTPEQRKRYRAANIGRKHTHEAREAVRAARLGKTIPDSARQKISETLTGRQLSPEHRQKIGEANRRRHVSDETKQAIAEKARDRKIPSVAAANSRRVWDEAARQRHSEAMRLAAQKRKLAATCG
jgi:hypothetical protein